MHDALKLAGGGPLQIDDLPKAAAELLQQSDGLKVWLVKGEMGAGDRKSVV